MNRKQAVVAAVAVIIGFILGFFTAQMVSRSQLSAAPPSGAAAGVPENHPTPQTMERLDGLQQQAEREPSNRAVRVELGNAYYDMGRFDLAVAWYEQALGLGGNDPNVSTDMGTAMLYQGEIEAAIQVYQQSLAMEPGHPQTLQNLGIAHYSAGRYTEAVTYWEELLTRHPNYQNATAIQEQIDGARDKASQAQQP